MAKIPTWHNILVVEAEYKTNADLTPAQKKDRERIVLGMKKNSAEFKKRYGSNADSVIYATATKLALRENQGTGAYLTTKDQGYPGTIVAWYASEHAAKAGLESISPTNREKYMLVPDHGQNIKTDDHFPDASNPNSGHGFAVIRLNDYGQKSVVEWYASKDVADSMALKKQSGQGFGLSVRYQVQRMNISDLPKSTRLNEQGLSDDEKKRRDELVTQMTKTEKDNLVAKHGDNWLSALYGIATQKIIDGRSSGEEEAPEETEAEPEVKDEVEEATDPQQSSPQLAAMIRVFKDAYRGTSKVSDTAKRISDQNTESATEVSNGEHPYYTPSQYQKPYSPNDKKSYLGRSNAAIMRHQYSSLVNGGWKPVDPIDGLPTLESPNGKFQVRFSSTGKKVNFHFEVRAQKAGGDKKKVDEAGFLTKPRGLSGNSLVSKFMMPTSSREVVQNAQNLSDDDLVSLANGSNWQKSGSHQELQRKAIIKELGKRGLEVPKTILKPGETSQSLKLNEKEITPAEARKRDDIFRKLQPKKSEYERKYGAHATSMMFADATKQAIETTRPVDSTTPASPTTNTFESIFRLFGVSLNEDHEEGESEETPAETKVAVVPVQKQAAATIAKKFGVEVDPDDDPASIINAALENYLKSSHSRSEWEDAGRMLALAKNMDIEWNQSLLKSVHRKVMQLEEQAQADFFAKPDPTVGTTYRIYIGRNPAQGKDGLPTEAKVESVRKGLVTFSTGTSKEHMSVHLWHLSQPQKI